MSNSSLLLNDNFSVSHENMKTAVDGSKWDEITFGLDSIVKKFKHTMYWSMKGTFVALQAGVESAQYYLNFAYWRQREREEAVIVFPIEVLSQTVGKLSYFSAFHISLFLGPNRCATAINTEI